MTLDEPLVRAIATDYDRAPISAADRAMLDFAGKVALDAVSIRSDDHERLRAHGFDDRAILQVTLIAAWFCSINRVADALGVGREGGA